MRLARLGLPLVLLLVLALAPPALARVAAIETTAPLADHTDESIEAALEEAVLTAVRGAVAMGFQWVQVHQATVLADIVSVQVLASDTAPEDEDEPGPDDGHETARPAGRGTCPTDQPRSGRNAVDPIGECAHGEMGAANRRGAAAHGPRPRPVSPVHRR